MFAVLPTPHRTILPVQALSPTQYVCKFPLSPSFTNLVVFILPDQQLPSDTMVGIYLNLPSMPPQEFKLLGALGPVIDADGKIIPGPEGQKLSAIFKVAGLSDLTSSTSAGDMEMDSGSAPASTTNEVQVGISIEPIQVLGPQVLAMNTNKTSSNSTSTALVTQAAPSLAIQPNTKVLAQRIIQNAFNFLASFSGGGGQEVIPLKAFEEWWKKFERRVEADPGFLERDI